jgi:hypothetical protein
MACAMIATFPVRMASVAVMVLVSLAFAAPLRAQGYVDPGAGAMLWQILAAGAVGAVFLFRKFVLRWFRARKDPRFDGEARKNSPSDQ